MAPWAASSIFESTEGRLAQVHDDLAGRPMTVAALGFRTSGQFPSIALISVRCSTAATSASTVNAAFDDNHGANRATVVSVRTVSVFGAVSPPQWAPTTDLVIPFDVPYLFDGSGPFCWELDLYSNSNPPGGSFEYVMGADPGRVMAFQFGHGCQVSAGAGPYRLQMFSPPTMNWSAGVGVFPFAMSKGPPSGLALLAGGPNNGMAFGLPTPVAIPGTLSAPSALCELHVDPVAQILSVLDANGSSSVPLNFPVSQAMNGFNAIWQGYALAPLSNPAGVITTGGCWTHIVAPSGVPPIGSVRSSSVSAPSGTALQGEGIVTEFR